VLAYGQGDNDGAEAQAAGVHALATARGEFPFEAFAITLKGLVTWRRGDPVEAARLHRRALEIAAPTNDPWFLGDLQYHLGMALAERTPAEAIPPLTESLARLRAAGGLHHLMLTLGTLADAQARLGRTDAARALFAEGLELGRTGADPITTVWIASFALAHLAEQGLADRAVPLLAGLDAYTRSFGYQATPLEQVAYDRARAAARKQLGAAAATAAWGAGQPTTPAAAVRAAAALMEVTLSPPTPAPKAGGKGILSAREHEVLVLVAEGRSNREIAAALIVSENTAKYHVNSLFNKLGTNSRAETVARAVALGLLSPQRD
jgi:ATP/maltotriose-dependent transcriptional regulator MalT